MKAGRRLSRMCAMCGGLIKGQSVSIWTQRVTEGQDAPVQWKRAHAECAALLDDDEEEEESHP